MFKNKYIIKGNVTEIYCNYRNEEPKICLIDTDDLSRLIEYNKTWHSWPCHTDDTYYIIASVYVSKNNTKDKSTTIFMHSFIMNASTRDKTNRIIVDHKNNNPLDNRKENLRIADNDQNTKNRKGKNSNNKSGHRNVSWNGNTWSVQLQIEGKNTTLKRFKKDQLEVAGAYAKEMRLKYYGEFAGKS